MDLPILEEDFDSPGVIEPTDLLHPIDIAPCAVLCFFREVVDELATRDTTRRVIRLRSEMGVHPVWEVDRAGRRLVVLQAPVGAPLAVGLLEELIALGVRTFVAVGGAGALTPELVLGHAVVVDSAVRDEGTSYHYLPASRTVAADPAGVRFLEQTLTDAGVTHVTGRTWTTDAFYRETRSRTDRRRAEGCFTVEMEASAFLAVAAFRGVRLAHLLYAGDSLAEEAWSSRDWTTAAAVRAGLFEVAADAALRWQDEVEAQG